MYEIFLMQDKDIPESLEIWHKQYLKYSSDDFSPNFWNGGNEAIIEYLKSQIKQSFAIVAKKDNVIVGFMAWMYFDFHAERSAFCPITGHAAVEDDSNTIYHTMYNYAANRWVKDNRFNHLWMIMSDDCVTKDMLYDIGFGSYVIDAYTKTSKAKLEVDCPYSITIANTKDADILYSLCLQSTEYYIETPIFLKRHSYIKQDIADIIEHDILFVAWDKGTPIGFMNLSVNQNYDIESLASPQTGLISKLGAYIKPEYRGIGIGKKLLSEVNNYCVSENIPYLHVSFETANPFANIFWRKHFKPVVLSVRRTVNKDANKDE